MSWPLNELVNLTYDVLNNWALGIISPERFHYNYGMSSSK